MPAAAIRFLEARTPGVDADARLRFGWARPDGLRDLAHDPADLFEPSNLLRDFGSALGSGGPPVSAAHVDERPERDQDSDEGDGERCGTHEC